MSDPMQVEAAKGVCRTTEGQPEASVGGVDSPKEKAGLLLHSARRGGEAMSVHCNRELYKLFHQLID